MPPKRPSSTKSPNPHSSTSSIESQIIFRKYGISPDLFTDEDEDFSLETDSLINSQSSAPNTSAFLPPPSPSAFQTISIPYRIDVISFLLYIFGSFLPVFVLFFEPKNYFIRFHAMQAFLFTMILIIAQCSIIILFQNFLSFGYYVAIFILGSIPSIVFATMAFIQTPSLIPFRLPLLGELSDVLLA